MKFSIFVVLILASAVAEAVLPTHMAQNAETLKPGHVSFEPYPGANPLSQDDFLSVNSFSVGVYPRIQIGTVPRPWFQQTAEQKFENVTTKVSLYRGEELRTSLGLLIAGFENRQKNEAYFAEVKGTLVQPSVNLALQLDEDWDITYNVSSAVFSYRVTGVASKDNRSFEDRRVLTGYLDHVLDFRYAQTGTYYWIFGLSRNYPNLAGMFDLQKPVYGAGVSYGWIFTRGYISMVSAGFHFTDKNEIKTLVGLAL